MRSVVFLGCLAIFTVVGTPVLAEPDAAETAAILEGLALQSDALIESFELGEFRAVTRVRELDGDGEVKTERRTVDLIEQKEGKPEARLIEAIEDGEDVLEKTKVERAERREKARKKAKEEGVDEKKRGDFPNPFRGAVQREYRFELLPPSKRFPEALRIAFRPQGKPKKELFVGQAIIDPETRRMLQLTARPSKYPFGLDEMLFSVSFGEIAGRPTLRRIVGSGKGGLPLMKKRFEFRSEFDRWSFPGAEAKQAPEAVDP